MKKIIFTLALWVGLTTSAYAAEMIMFSMKSCGYCRAFLKEVAPTYAESKYAKLLPLRIISMDTPAAPKWFEQAYDDRRIDSIVGTPTFVIFENRTEVARLIGYTSKEKFYRDIGDFVENNKKRLESTVGQNTIPYEPENELDPKAALNREEGSHSQSAPPMQEERNTNPHTGELEKFPNGVYKSRDILDHQYKTETEAQVAANFLGCRGVHSHMIDGKKIFMPCTME